MKHSGTQICLLTLWSINILHWTRTSKSLVVPSVGKDFWCTPPYAFVEASATRIPWPHVSLKIAQVVTTLFWWFFKVWSIPVSSPSFLYLERAWHGGYRRPVSI